MSKAVVVHLSTNATLYRRQSGEYKLVIAQANGGITSKLFPTYEAWRVWARNVLGYDFDIPNTSKMERP